jgi:5-methylcytosine-specific restriction endonuclease McrA
MDVRDWSTDRVERLAVDAEAEIARQRAIQVVALAELDRRQTASADGCRTLWEWTAGRLDVSSVTARALVRVARSGVDRPDLVEALAGGGVGFDRVAVLAGSDLDLDGSFRWDVGGLGRVVARRTGTAAPPMRFCDRYLAIQPSLDLSRWKIWGQLTGDAGAIVDTVLSDRADSFPALPDGTRASVAVRRADALVTVCVDADSSDGSGSSSREPSVTVFVDATTPPATGEALSPTSGPPTPQLPLRGPLPPLRGGQTRSEALSPAAAVAAGPVIDSDTVAALACEGSSEVTGITSDGVPLAYGRRRRAIPARLRRYVLHRDGGCVADGCDSRYRLQAHHIVPWSEGGRTDPDNLVTLCWFHHHVVVHRMGYRIDPDSPAFRRRFLPPGHHPP